MRVLIELPTWLGDAVMTTPAIENIISHFNDIEITLIGSFASTQALKNHPKVVDFIELDKSLKGILNIFKNFQLCVLSKCAEHLPAD